MNNNVEAVLDRKFQESYKLYRKENKRNAILGNLEVTLLLLAIVLFVAFLKYLFWGGGFNHISPQHHDFTMSTLAKMPGPQGELIQKAISKDGYVSLLDYSNYVEMANESTQPKKRDSLK